MIEPLTVSGVVNKAKTMVALPLCMILLLPMAVLIYWGDRYGLSPVMGVMGIVLCFVAAIFTGMYQTLKWEIWALQHVDDVLALKQRVESQTFSTGFPSKWTIGSRTDKKLVKELWTERSLKTPVYKNAISYDYTLPDETIITGSRAQNIAFLFCALGIAYVSFQNNVDHLQLYIVLSVVFIGFVYFLYKTLFPGKKLILSANGIWSEKAGFIKWGEVYRVYIWDDIERQGAQVEKLSIIKAGLIPQKSKNITLNIKSLGITSSRLEYTIKNYLAAYNKNSSVPLHFG
ncbi:MAG: hypothetical protein QM594_04460 [Niabella sp.]